MATASQSLFNMTVASDNAGGNQGLLMPKLQFRFRVTFLNFGVDTTNGLQLTKQVIDCSRPQVTFPDIVLPVYNSSQTPKLSLLCPKPNPRLIYEIGRLNLTNAT